MHSRPPQTLFKVTQLLEAVVTRYSIFSLARNALTGHKNWTEVWRSPEPKSEYDVVIVGAGGHGLATAYYLASQHGVRNIAVIDKGWLGGGNTGRNTTIIRSNYLWDESAAIYEHSMKLWEGLSQELNFNTMFSQRGVLTLAHSEHEMREMTRRVEAIRLNGIDSEVMNPEQIKRLVPIIVTDRQICAIRSWAGLSSAGVAPRAMTRSPGAMPGPPMSWASISFRTARSPAF